MTKTSTSEAPVALEDAEIDRVDLVKGPANGAPLLILKALEGQPDVRAALSAVAKSDETQRLREYLRRGLTVPAAGAPRRTPTVKTRAPQPPQTAGRLIGPRPTPATWSSRYLV